MSHAKYGACAVRATSALGPSHAPTCTDDKIAVSSSAVSAYAVLNEFHAPAAANKLPGPGPLLSRLEWISCANAIQTGAVMAETP